MTRRPPYPFTVGDNRTGQCSVCAEVFYGEEAFDRHRRGVEPDRGCIDPANPPRREDGTPEPWWLDSRERWHVSSPERRARAARLRNAQDAPATQDSRSATAGSGVTGTPALGASSTTGIPGSA